jgi:hypothetical protein
MCQPQVVYLHRHVLGSWLLSTVQQLIACHNTREHESVPLWRHASECSDLPLSLMGECPR